MAKQLTRTKLVKKLDTIFSQYIRKVNSDNEISTCFTCGKQDHWKKLQNGHFQSRRGCNVFKYGEQFIFGQNLDRKFGEGTARRLHIKAQETIKITSPELEEMIFKYENLVSNM